MRYLKLTMALGLVLVVAGPLWAHVWLVGFSGAPGTYGTCSYNCHGYPGGSIRVTRFPASYRPGQTYNIKVDYDPTVVPDSIENFNLSIRVGRGSVNAGVITAGYGTETYSDSVETNGLHALARCDSCNFNWTAPAAGTDTVRLYLGGFQGIEGEWGYNTLSDGPLILESVALTGVEGEEPLPPRPVAFSLRLAGANPARSGVALAYQAEGAEPAELGIYDLCGRLVRSFRLAGRGGVLRWDGRDAAGQPVPGGVYFFRLEQGRRTTTGKALLMR